MEYSRLITALPADTTSKYIDREVLGYIIKDDNTLTCESDILNSRYPNIRVVEGKLLSYDKDAFRKCFTVIAETESGFKSTYVCDMIRVKKIEEKKHFVGKEAVALNNAIIAATESLNMFPFCEVKILGDAYGLDKGSYLKVSLKVRRDGSKVYTYRYFKGGEPLKSISFISSITVEVAIAEDGETHIVATDVVGSEYMEKYLNINMCKSIENLFLKN